ncbi:hypothetical protein AB1K32_15185 [Metabacillus dongyingensis]|uniref:hypothetical protein n=1 Tax=Metabacillus dongyingensis TaxID=2874282 RepID=UPI003B8BA7F1
MDLAVYKGDEFICLGTARECAEYMGIKVDSVRFYLSPVYKRRIEARDAKNAIIVIKIEED